MCKETSDLECSSINNFMENPIIYVNFARSKFTDFNKQPVDLINLPLRYIDHQFQSYMEIDNENFGKILYKSQYYLNNKKNLVFKSGKELYYKSGKECNIYDLLNSGIKINTKVVLFLEGIDHKLYVVTASYSTYNSIKSFVILNNNSTFNININQVIKYSNTYGVLSFCKTNEDFDLIYSKADTTKLIDNSIAKHIGIIKEKQENPEVTRFKQEDRMYIDALANQNPMFNFQEIEKNNKENIDNFSLVNENEDFFDDIFLDDEEYHSDVIHIDGKKYFRDNNIDIYNYKFQEDFFNIETGEILENEENFDISNELNSGYFTSIEGKDTYVIGGKAFELSRL